MQSKKKCLSFPKKSLILEKRYTPMYFCLIHGDWNKDYDFFSVIPLKNQTKIQMHANWLVFFKLFDMLHFFLIVCVFFFYLIFFNICQSLGLLKSKLCSCIFFIRPCSWNDWKKKYKLCAQIVFFFYILCCFSIYSRFPKHWMSITKIY